MYVPLAAVVTLVVIGGYEALGRLFKSAGRGDRLRPWAGGALVGVILAVLGCLTYVRNEDYQSSITMWTDVVAKRPRNPRARTALGIALLNNGRSNEAITQLKEAQRIDPHRRTTAHNLGFALQVQGRNEEAAEQYRRALRIAPNSAKARTNLGMVLAEQGKLAEAATECRRALRPDYPTSHINMGYVLRKQGKTDEAIKCFIEAIRIEPVNSIAHYNLALALAHRGRRKESQFHYRTAVRLNPSLRKLPMPRTPSPDRR